MPRVSPHGLFSTEARVALAFAAICLAPPVAADADLDRIEARLIQLEKEITATVKTVTLAITPADAMIIVNGAEVRNGEPIAYLTNQQFQISAAGEHLKPFTALLTPAAQHTRLVVEVCPTTIAEEFLFQPPDKVTTEQIGSAERRFEGPCPLLLDEGRKMADQACATQYEGATRNSGRQFTLQQEFTDGVRSRCKVIAECVVKKSVTQEKVKRLRDVDNTACTGSAELN